jgi:hypothetical protein
MVPTPRERAPHINLVTAAKLGLSLARLINLSGLEYFFAVGGIAAREMI